LCGLNFLTLLAFKYLEQEKTLIKLDLNQAKETNEDKEMIKIVQKLIENNRKAPTFSQLRDELIDAGYPKIRAEKIIKSGEGRYWTAERQKGENRLLYYPIQAQKETEIVFQTIKKDENTKSSLGSLGNLGNPMGRDFLKNHLNQETQEIPPIFQDFEQKIEIYAGV